MTISENIIKIDNSIADLIELQNKHEESSINWISYEIEIKALNESKSLLESKIRKRKPKNASRKQNKNNKR